jgi:hypothetical protein
LSETELVDEVYGKNCNNKGNVVIMGYSPNPKKLIEYNNNRGWCYEGSHCRNVNCKFKHRDMKDNNIYLTSSIRGPRQHSRTSSAKNND